MELKKGDILLYSGDSWSTRIIQLCDQSEYAHASVYMGEGKVIETSLTGGGCKIVDVNKSALKYKKVLVRRHEIENLDMAPVMERCLKLNGSKYDAYQILQLGMIAASRRISKFNNPVLKLFSKVFDLATEFSLYLRANGDEKSVCSELAYRAFQDAIVGPQGIDDVYNVELKFESTMLSGRKGLTNAVYPEVLSNGSLIAFFYGNKEIRSNKNVSHFIDSITNNPPDKDIDSLRSMEINTNWEFEFEALKGTDEVNSISKDFTIKKQDIKEIEDLLLEIENTDKDNLGNEAKIDYKELQNLEKKLNKFMILNSSQYIKDVSTNNTLNSFQNMAIGQRKKYTSDFIRNRNNFVTAKDLRKASNFRDIGFYKNNQ